MSLRATASVCWMPRQVFCRCIVLEGTRRFLGEALPLHEMECHSALSPSLGAFLIAPHAGKRHREEI